MFCKKYLLLSKYSLGKFANGGRIKVGTGIVLCVSACNVGGGRTGDFGCLLYCIVGGGVDERNSR